MDPQDHPFSWHKGRGWESQFDRVTRWHERAAAVLKSGESHTLSEGDWDVIYAFFMNAYHMGDWMIADRVITRDQWSWFIRENFELGLCRDLCNGLKHRRLTHPSTVDPAPWTRREYVPPPLATGGQGGERWYVQAGEEKDFYPFEELIDKIMWLLRVFTPEHAGEIQEIPLNPPGPPGQGHGPSPGGP